MAMFGITTKIANEKYLNFLCSQGSLPAFYFLKSIYSKEADAVSRILVQKNHMKKRHPYLEKELDADPIKALSYRKKLFVLKRQVLDLPFKALINPFNNPELNVKLFNISPSVTIGEKRVYIKDRNLRISNIKFSSADFNKIRLSILWINWFLFHDASLSRPKHLNLCLSQDAYSMLIASNNGPIELLKYAKKNKRELKNLLNSFGDNQRSTFAFLSNASLELDQLIQHRMTRPQISRLIQCYEYHKHSTRPGPGIGRMANYYIYNPNILKTQKTLELLFYRGYKRVNNMKLFDPSNKEAIVNSKLYDLLHKNFSDFKF
jgi:hypothetical protein